MGEKIIVHGTAGGVDDDGYPLPGAADREVEAKNVQPLSLEEMSDSDKEGTVDVLRVWLHRGHSVAEGDDVTVRGLRYRVRTTAWDWGRNRRPVNPRHRPGVVFDCERGAG